VVFSPWRDAVVSSSPETPSFALTTSKSVLAGSRVSTFCFGQPQWLIGQAIAGAGLPGLIFAGGGLLGWWRRRQKIA
jgi:hypothetical protein